MALDARSLALSLFSPLGLLLDYLNSSPRVCQVPANEDRAPRQAVTFQAMNVDSYVTTGGLGSSPATSGSTIVSASRSTPNADAWSKMPSRRGLW